MRWAYDDNTRDLFGKGIHRDILIVPHATNVIKVAGGPPEITSKVPEFKWNETGGKDHAGQYEPVKENGHYVYQDVEWTITNDDIVKEKFKYYSSLNSDDNLTFSSCNAAMIQFTIRNKKEYVQDEETQEYYWKPEIPNLFKYEYTQKDGNGNTQKIVGELMSNACIKAYMYFNGDSSTLMYLGMFKVEEDKLIDNGYNRQITAYDFLAWFREIDIFYWYKHLFEGINKLGNDYEDYTNDTNSKEKHTQAEWDKNYIREPKEKWTIGEALNDLIDHFAAYDMTVFEEEVVNEQTGEKKNVMKLGATSTNPNDYGRDDYEEGNGYTGLGMPIILDSNVMTKGAKPYMPTKPGANEKEQYGYMNILELEFYQDPKIMKSESLSAGKLLEDIGLLAGRYPYIRTDDFVDGDYIDPKTITPTEEEKHPSKYICYEKCILTFKPLPSTENDKNVDKVPESMFDNHDIVKGFQHDYYQVQDITVMKFELDDGTEIKYSKLNKSQLVAEQKSELQTFTITNNMFANYLVTKSDDDDVKKMLDKYKVIREKLFGKDSTAGNISPDALFNQGYNNIRNRIYTPYQLTTFADPVRDVGDRIKIDFTDMITGEQSHFYTYILERSMEGIQKCMDTYTAKGTMRNPLFTNYQISTKAKSGGDTGQTSEDLDIMTPFDLIEYMRNCGYRMLDEPTGCEAVFAKGSETTDGGIKYSYKQVQIVPTGYENAYWMAVEHNVLINNPQQNPIHVYGSDWDTRQRIDCGMYEAKDLDMVYEFDDETGLGETEVIFIFYQGTWYPAYPHDYSIPSYINTIADMYAFIPDQVKEGVSGGFSLHYEYDETEEKFVKALYTSTYDVLTINGNSTQVKYSDNINTSGGYVKTFIPPGIWSTVNNTSGGPFTETTLSDIICYHCKGASNDSNIYDGSTTTTVNVYDPDTQVSYTVEVQEYDYVDKNNFNDQYIFYDGSWKNITEKQRQIADISTRAKIEAIPEIAAIMLKGNPGTYQWSEYERLYGYDINTLTINGQTVNVEVFDTLKIPYGYLTYTPNHVWYNINLRFSSSDNNIYVPIRSGLSLNKPYIQLKWSDPPDIDTWEPYPCAWEGTVIVRKENSAPLHRWDGEKVVVNKTRDKYKTKAYKDEDIKMGRTYYYGFFPYYTADDSDPEHPIRYYTFTKVIKVETGDNSIASTIDSIDVNGNTATIKYTLEQPDGASFASVKIYGKIGSNPNCDDTDDVVVDADPEAITKDIPNLEYDSTYYFCLVTVDNNDEELSSNVEIAQIEADPGPQPDPQYVEYIDLINGNNNLYKYYMTDNWMQLYDGLTRGFYYFNDEGKKYTYVISNGSRRSIWHWNNSNYWSNYIAYYNGNYYSTYKCYALNIIDININGDNDSYTITTSSLNPNPNFINNRFGENIPCYAGNLQYYYNNNTWSFGVSTDTTSKPTVEDITYTGTLEDCFKYLAMNVRNANIYVNGVLWALSANND